MPNLFGKIYNSALAGNAKFFEEAIFNVRDTTAENKAQIERVKFLSFFLAVSL